MSAAPAPTPSAPADLGLAQSETVAPTAFGNDVVDDHVTIENNGPGDATDVVLHDTVPPGATIESATIDQGSCTVGATDVTCVIPHLDAGGSAVADIVLVEPAGDALAGSTSEASISAAQFDPTPSNNSGDADGHRCRRPAPRRRTSAVQDQESSAQDTLGGTLTDTITVINNGPGAATGVDLTDALDAAAQVTAIDPGASTCDSGADIQCSLAELAPGASADARGARATAPPGAADRRRHRKRRRVRSELRQRLGEDRRHGSTAQDRGEVANRPCSNPSPPRVRWSPSWSRSAWSNRSRE